MKKSKSLIIVVILVGVCVVVGLLLYSNKPKGVDNVIISTEPTEVETAVTDVIEETYSVYAEEEPTSIPDSIRTADELQETWRLEPYSDDATGQEEYTPGLYTQSSEKVHGRKPADDELYADILTSREFWEPVNMAPYSTEELYLSDITAANLDTLFESNVIRAAEESLGDRLLLRDMASFCLASHAHPEYRYSVGIIEQSDGHLLLRTYLRSTAYCFDINQINGITTTDVYYDYTPGVN